MIISKEALTRLTQHFRVAALETYVAEFMAKNLIKLHGSKRNMVAKPKDSPHDRVELSNRHKKQATEQTMKAAFPTLMKG